MAEQAAGPYVGKPLSVREFVVDDAILDDFHNGLELARTEAARVPSMIANGAEDGYFNEIAYENHFGHLWMRQEWEFLGELAPGGSYTASGRIRDIYRRRDRSVVQYEVDLHDASGTLVVRSQHHQSFLPDADPTGAVAFRNPGKKPGARKFIVPEGERFGGLERTITLEMCGEFFHGDANYHTDKDASLELGFEDVVVGGRMTMAYAGHILEEAFGAAWWTSGRLDLKFTNPVWTGDTVTAHGVMTGPVAEDTSRSGAFVWLAKQDETVALVATASVAAN